MKPHVICHMVSSVDGRTLNSRWRPDGKIASALFERLHDELGGDAWLIGRVTGQEFAKGKPYPATTDRVFPRKAWFAQRDAKAYGVVLDAHGKIAWGRSDIGGDPIVAVLSEQVSDAHLAGLRSEGVSYIFAGETELDLGLALEISRIANSPSNAYCSRAAAARTAPFCAPGWPMNSVSCCVQQWMAPRARPASSIKRTWSRGPLPPLPR